MCKIIGQRLKQFRKLIEKTQGEIALECMTSQANVARIESGAQYPNYIFLSFLHKKFDLNIHWLITGIGKTFAHHNKTDYGEYSEDMEELFYYLENVPIARHAILKYFKNKKFKS